ncbi:beta-ketoacyl synthase N-terminal-like domain-containing protein [Streptomyces sp. NPDC058157]|uniref:beta-ketoacyl synthase N-terminal-like domain-containing protein n=1 Tax=Streptomyces sp. NPDC058157 TaxID=3346360 RepID=UPI0036E710B5
MRRRGTGRCGRPRPLCGRGDTAAVIGASNGEYVSLQTARPETFSPYMMLGTAGCNLADRVSHALDLRGPSYTVDTARASALTAVHQACLAIRSGRVDTAPAGGASVLLGPWPSLGFAAARMLSPTGRCPPALGGGRRLRACRGGPGSSS